MSGILKLLWAVVLFVLAGSLFAGNGSFLDAIDVRASRDSSCFSGRLAISPLIEFGYDEETTFSGSGQLHFNPGLSHHHFVLDGGSLTRYVDFFEKSRRLTKNNYSMQLRWVVRGDGRVDGEVYCQVSANKSLANLQRRILGYGLCYNICDYDPENNHHFGFQSRASFMVEEEGVNVASGDIHPCYVKVGRLSLGLKAKKSFVDDKIFTSAFLFYQPKIVDFDLTNIDTGSFCLDYRLFGRLEVMVDVFEGWGAGLSFDYHYDSLPPMGVKNFNGEMSLKVYCNF